jgi:hypothetical protein
MVSDRGVRRFHAGDLHLFDRRSGDRAFPGLWLSFAVGCRLIASFLRPVTAGVAGSPACE